MTHPPFFLLAAASLMLASPAIAAEEAASANRAVLTIVASPLSRTAGGFAGTISPAIKADLSFRTFGRMVARDTNIGDVVSKGQLLATLDPISLELNVRLAEANLASAEAQFVNAQGAEGRQQAMLDSKVTTQANVESALASRAAAEASVLRARANLTKAQEQLGYARLTAPFDGVVTAAPGEVGQVVSAGSTVVTVARPDVREAVVDIPDEDAADLLPGAPFTVVHQLNADMVVNGRAREIAPSSDATTRSRRVKIQLDNPPEAFRIGSTIKAIPTKPAHRTVVVPIGSIDRRDGAMRVWVVDKDVVHPQKVTAEITPDGNYAIVSSGLDAGTRVVTAGLSSLKDGQMVRIAERASR